MNSTSSNIPAVHSLLNEYGNELKNIKRTVITSIDAISNGFNQMKQKRALDKVGTQITENLQIQKAKAFNDRTIVALIGESGVGKSTLTNALLGYDNLAPTSGIRACTTVVTEISQLPSDAKCRFIGEVEYIPLKDYQEDLDLSISDIKDWLEGKQTEEAEASQSSHNKKPQLERDSEMDKAKDLAEAKICALFPDFEHAQLDNLPQMLKELYKNQNLSAGIQSICVNDEKEFVTTLGGLTSDNGGKDKTPSYWPLVKCVRMHVDAEILRTGIVLVDLPGVRDSNAARAAIAEDYMRKADEIIIVSPLNRILSNKTVETLANGYVRQLAFDLRKKIVIVCTKCEMYDIDDALKDYPDDEQLHKDKHDVEEDIISSQERLSRENDDEAYERLEDTIEELIQAIAFQARDRNVPNLIQNKFKDLLGEDFVVDTFLVASKVFKELNSANRRRSKSKRKGSVNQAMTIEETQVPKLRLYCAKIPLMRKVQFTTLSTNQLTDSLMAISLWLLEPAKLSDVVRANMNKDLELAKKTLMSGLEELIKSLTVSISTNFHKIETAAIKAAGISKEAAREKEQELAKTIRYNTYKAACRRNGDWPNKQFNNMFLECFDEEIGKVWRPAMNDTRRICSDYYTEWRSQINIFGQTWCLSVQQHLNFDVDSEDPALTAATSSIELVKNKLQEEKTSLTDALEAQQTHMRDPFRRTDILRERLQDAYSAATAQTGRGCLKNMSRTLSESLDESQPIFDSIRDQTIERLNEGNQKLVSQFMDSANQSIDSLWQYYKHWSNENIALSKDEEQGRLNIKAIKQQAESDMIKLKLKLQILETKVDNL